MFLYIPHSSSSLRLKELSPSVINLTAPQAKRLLDNEQLLNDQGGQLELQQVYALAPTIRLFLPNYTICKHITRHEQDASTATVPCTDKQPKTWVGHIEVDTSEPEQRYWGTGLDKFYTSANIALSGLKQNETLSMLF